MKIRWLRLALLDLEDVEAWVAQENPAAADVTIRKIVRSVSILETQPGAGRSGRVPGTRELIVPGTPYLIPYRVQEGIVQILRVYHAARKWPDRL